MPRDFYINGESLVYVRGGVHTALHPDPAYTIVNHKELGLTSEQIKISPTFYSTEVHCDGFGPNVPAEVMSNLADVRIGMDLIHFDPKILDTCIKEAMFGGASVPLGASDLPDAGALMGNGGALYSSGNHFLSMFITSPNQTTPWFFPSLYLAGLPVEIPIGVGVSIVRCHWRAIAYKSLFSPGEMKSRGLILFNHNRPVDLGG